MKTYIKLSIMLSVLWFSTQAQTQQQNSDPKKFSLQEAVDYAKKNNYALKHNLLDVTAAQKKVSEILSVGLPQINASGNFTNNTTIASNVISFNGQSTVIKFGLPYTATGSIMAT